MMILYRFKFQSTPPRRERLFKIVFIARIIENFNPRPREGSDRGYSYTRQGRYISIHAPAKGATRTTRRGFKTMKISIHAPAKGATVIIEDGYSIAPISIHAPAKGATTVVKELLNGAGISIHAPAKGAT